MQTPTGAQLMEASCGCGHPEHWSLHRLCPLPELVLLQVRPCEEGSIPCFWRTHALTTPCKMILIAETAEHWHTLQSSFGHYLNDRLTVTGLSPRASLYLSGSSRSNGGDLSYDNGVYSVSDFQHAEGGSSPAGSSRLTQNGIMQNGLSPEGRLQPSSASGSGSLPSSHADQLLPRMLNGHLHGGLANGNGGRSPKLYFRTLLAGGGTWLSLVKPAMMAICLCTSALFRGLLTRLHQYAGYSHAAEIGRAAHSDAGSETASLQSEPPTLRLSATPSHPRMAQGSVASSVLAEATEASVLDSLADGASSVDEGSVAEEIRGNRCGLCMLWWPHCPLPFCPACELPEQACTFPV